MRNTRMLVGLMTAVAVMAWGAVPALGQSEGPLTTRTMEAQVVIYTLHRGGHDSLRESVDRVLALARERGLRVTGPVTFEFLAYSDLISGEHFLTEVRAPVGLEALDQSGTFGPYEGVKAVAEVEVAVMRKPRGADNREELVEEFLNLVHRNGYVAVGNVFERFLTGASRYADMESEFCVRIARPEAAGEQPQAEAEQPAAGAAQVTEAAPQSAEASVIVSAAQWGISTQYIGACEGNARFDIGDLTDCGINTYRLFAGMPRFEPEDDDGVYGSPSIAEIKADVDIIPWERWDEVMDGPVFPGLEVTLKQAFNDLKDAGIRTVVCLRIQDNDRLPEWVRPVPATEADWNEWWQHVFSVAYWLNVRNDYGVDDYEILQEPDSPNQGWVGTREQYVEVVRQARDALDHVYRTYIPDRMCRLHAPAVAEARAEWAAPTLREIGPQVDCLSVHCHINEHDSVPLEMHQAIEEGGRLGTPLWISQWGNYMRSWDEPIMAADLVGALILDSRPGNSHVDGSHVFSLYDWGNMWGLVHGDGTRTPSYYAMRLACRALQGGRPTFETTCESEDLLAITTKDADGGVNLLMANSSPWTAYQVTADLSSLLSGGRGSVRQANAEVYDEVIGQVELTDDGACRVEVPAQSAVLLQFEPAPALAEE
ncbi:MAG: hypothetical protein ACYTFZ_02455 [Planctomycetota bacterium]